MKKPRLRYILIIIASLLCLAATYLALQNPGTEAPLAAESLTPLEDQFDHAVGMLEDSLRRKAQP